jgi:hypothetical protein
VGLYAARSGARTATLRVGDGDSTEIVSLAFSPDSQQLLIAAHQYRRDVVVSELYVASLDGGWRGADRGAASGSLGGGRVHSRGSSSRVGHG